MQTIRVLGLGVVLIVISGCGGAEAPTGPPTVPVKLTVTLDDKPLDPKIELRLLPEPPKEGVSSVKCVPTSDGSYALETYTSGDGAPPGTYQVKLGSMDVAAVGATVPEIKPATLIIPNEGGAVSVNLVGTGKTQPGLLPPPPGQGRR